MKRESPLHALMAGLIEHDKKKLPFKEIDVLIDSSLTYLYKCLAATVGINIRTHLLLFKKELNVEIDDIKYRQTERKMIAFDLMIKHNDGGFNISDNGIRIMTKHHSYLKYLQSEKNDNWWKKKQLHLDVLSRPVIIIVAVLTVALNIYNWLENDKLHSQTVLTTDILKARLYNMEGKLEDIIAEKKPQGKPKK